MQSTVRNFWKMTYERNSAVVVMTSDLVEGGQEASAQYWPDSGTAHYGEFAVDLLGEEKLEGFTVRRLSITDTKVNIHHVT
jgi:protein tyrosine phosphatase